MYQLAILVLLSCFLWRETWFLQTSITQAGGKCEVSQSSSHYSVPGVKVTQTMWGTILTRKGTGSVAVRVVGASASARISLHTHSKKHTLSNRCPFQKSELSPPPSLLMHKGGWRHSSTRHHTLRAGNFTVAFPVAQTISMTIKKIKKKKENSVKIVYPVCCLVHHLVYHLA